VWEINVSSQAGRTYDPDAPSPLVATKVSVDATILGIGVEAAPVPSLDARPDASHPVSLSLRNRFGRVNAAAGSAPLGSAWRTSATIGAGEQQIFEILVPKGASSVRAAIARVGDAGADLDLYLLDCTEPEKPAEPPKELEKGNKAPAAPDPACAARAKADDRLGEADVEVVQPRAGRWLAVVDAFAVPSGKTAYDYLDVATHPRFGTLSVADVADDRAPAAAWTVKGQIWVAEVPAAPRRLHARVLVTSGAIAQPVRTVEGFGTTGLFNWLLPVGTLDLGAGTR
jgi:hypothetical protein